jgi:hypothetical protein
LIFVGGHEGCTQQTGLFHRLIGGSVVQATASSCSPSCVSRTRRRRTPSSFSCRTCGAWCAATLASRGTPPPSRCSRRSRSNNSSGPTADLRYGPIELFTWTGLRVEHLVGLLDSGAADGTQRLPHLRQQARARLAHAHVEAREDDVVLGAVDAQHTLVLRIIGVPPVWRRCYPVAAAPPAA